MPKFLCQRTNPIPNGYKVPAGLYQRGKVYEFEEKPNHHFVALGKEGEIEDETAEFDPTTEPDFHIDSFEALMAKKFTKKEIVDTVKENYERNIQDVDKGLAKEDKKAALVKAAIDARENYVPQPK